MNRPDRIEQALHTAIDTVAVPSCPPRLIAAMRHAVFPAGARVRPRLTLAVAQACGENDPSVTDAAACAIEFMHCASLVHDDLPCFDDADLRRGVATVHKSFGEPLAVLAGDALILLAFQTLGLLAHAPQTAGAFDHDAVARCRRAVRHHRRPGVGVRADDRPAPLPSRQDRCPVRRGRHRRRGGGRCAEAEPWRMLGETLGEAYQAADDIGDACAADDRSRQAGRPRQDPRAPERGDRTRSRGRGGAARDARRPGHRLESRRAGAPPVSESLVDHEARRLLPRSLTVTHERPLDVWRRTMSAVATQGSTYWERRLAIALVRLVAIVSLARPAFPALGVALSVDAAHQPRAARSGLFDLCAGFVYSQILFACVALKLFETLEAGSDCPSRRSSRTLRPGAGGDAASPRFGAARLHLVEKHGDAYGLGVHGAAYLGNPVDRRDDRPSRDALPRSRRSRGTAQGRDKARDRARQRSGPMRRRRLQHALDAGFGRALQRADGDVPGAYRRRCARCLSVRRSRLPARHRRRRWRLPRSPPPIVDRTCASSASTFQPSRRVPRRVSRASACPGGRARSAATSKPIRCQPAWISFRSCESRTISTTAISPRSSPRSAKPCRLEASFFWQSLLPRCRGLSVSVPTSRCTSSRCSEAVPAPRRSLRAPSIPLVSHVSAGLPQPVRC